jgi:hypothetical protein
MTMATVNVYVPDALKARLEKANLNLSSYAQEAWEAALARAELPEGEFALDVTDKEGDAIELRFTGRLIAASNKNNAELYLTDEGNLVLVDEEGGYTVSGPDEDVDAEDLWNFLRDDEAVAEACRNLGIKNVVRL